MLLKLENTCLGHFMNEIKSLFTLYSHFQILLDFFSSTFVLNSSLKNVVFIFDVKFKNSAANQLFQPENKS